MKLAKRKGWPRRRWLPLLVVAVLMAGVGATGRGREIVLWQWHKLFPGSVRRVAPRDAIAVAIVAGAKGQEGTLYNATYKTIAYPNGDVSQRYGACTDVVVRALRHAGYDLQQLIHEDMARNFAAYPHGYGLSKPDPNIDHRRVPNQMRFFTRHGLKLTTEVSLRTVKQWQPGDIVCWEMPHQHQHTGVISDGISGTGLPLVIHNNGICLEADCLTRWKIIGHFRYPLRPHGHRPGMVI